MIQMRIREMSACPEHGQTIIVLEDATGRQKLAIGVNPDESRRLVRELSDGAAGKDPVYEFLERVLDACAIPATRVVLEYVPGAGLRSLVSFRRPEGEVAVPCYVTDALAVAARTNVPIYLSPSAFADGGPLESSEPDAVAAEDVARWLERIRPADFSSGEPGAGSIAG